jgi:fluoride exporter
MGHRIDDPVGDSSLPVFQAQGLAVNAVLMVAAGGALGSVARYGLNIGVTRTLGEAFPWGILLANVLGCFLMGVLGAYFMHRMPEGETARLFLTTGFLGGFTTFSAFSFDILKLVNGGQNNAAILYVLASVGLSVLAVFVGFLLVKA